ncbi:CPBP family intramembrane glutamic endopeptidase [Bacillus sp. S/N-304-OC-R1]|uniref:CPBP family intramembrane glutamic endopeptidase n=1 Tax=Bacillus sp. S/N-304-OC-R1 TaxID=2758034 RepID=UPI001C8ECAA2|nr:type II CAAX endopeptidase family protein [Bacillus sp. S/N-304-OC-R1]MBY0123057.1 CPBP family intramembrane metalloprotease [Bacillus sp. S/N-304-OC-R1]
MIVFGIILLIFLIGIYPFWDKKYTKRLEETLDEKDRIAYFKYVIYSEWAVTFIILIAVYLSGTAFAQIGLGLPGEDASQFSGMIVGFIIGILVMIFVLMRLPFYRKYQEAQTSSVSYLVPTGKIDKRLAILVALTAGICEEIIYRGFLLHLLALPPFQLEGNLILIVGAAIFGIAHYYQGWKGVLLTGLVGFALSKVYLQTGSLVFPIIMHALIDLRFMLTKPKK